jgi:riboflavin biosynthesis pyrimidine reductase
MEPFEVLLETQTGPSLPEPLAQLYGTLAFTGPALYANFVQSLDGVVRLGDRATGGAVIADHSDADRFLMGLLRASADAVLIGAGTLRGSPGHRWSAEGIQPDWSAQWAELREAAGRPPVPLTVVVTENGDIDPAHPGLSERALVLTNARVAERLRPVLPAACAVEDLGGMGAIDLRGAVRRVRDLAGGMILSEAGPRVTAGLVDLGLLDELFLTVSPLIAGRALGYDGLVAGQAFLPDRRVGGTLVSVRRHGDHLFLRHRLEH